MVKLIGKDLDWKAREQQIRNALLLHGQQDPSLILHLSSAGHTFEKLDKQASIVLSSPYQEKGLMQRLVRSSPTQEILLKAIGCRGNYRPTVIDATAGFGIDALLMGFNTCFVSSIEWNPLICFLVADGFFHLKDSVIQECIQRQVHYYQGDARLLIPELPPHDVIYLDPMFPSRRKQSKVKKYMQMMQMMTALYPEYKTDENQLFEIASQYAIKRVVVKRPKGEEPITPRPNYSLASQSIRFDVYLSGSSSI